MCRHQKALNQAWLSALQEWQQDLSAECTDKV